jgi:hypothetical protein
MLSRSTPSICAARGNEATWSRDPDNETSGQVLVTARGASGQEKLERLPSLQINLSAASAPSMACKVARGPATICARYPVTSLVWQLLKAGVAPAMKKRKASENFSLSRIPLVDSPVAAL